MAEINAKDLTTKTSPASTDSMLLFGTTSNEGAKITVDNLADNILSRLSTKTFPNQVGGSSAATILAQLATLNSNLYKIQKVLHNKVFAPSTANNYEYTQHNIQTQYDCLLLVRGVYNASPCTGLAVGGSNSSRIQFKSHIETNINAGLEVVTVCENYTQQYIWLKSSETGNVRIDAWIIGNPGTVWVDGVAINGTASTTATASESI